METCTCASLASDAQIKAGDDGMSDLRLQVEFIELLHEGFAAETKKKQK